MARANIRNVIGNDHHLNAAGEDHLIVTTAVIAAEGGRAIGTMNETETEIETITTINRTGRAKSTQSNQKVCIPIR